MLDPLQDWNPHFFENISLSYFFINLIKKNNAIEVLKEALGAKDDAERAEYDDLEEANIAKITVTVLSARKCTLIRQN